MPFPLEFLNPSSMPSMTFRNAVIEVFIERGEKSYDISSINGLANSLSSMKMELISDGMASTVELTYNPPFEVAVALIESGILGIGLLPEDNATNLSNFNFTQGLMQVTKAAGVLLDKASQIFGAKSNSSSGKVPDPVKVASGMGMSLKVRWWYEEMGPRHISPVFYGTMNPPHVSFGEEITLTISAQASVEAAAIHNDKNVSHDGKSVKDIADDIAKRFNVGITWTPSAEREAGARKLKEQQDINDMMYLHEIITRIGCMVYVDGNQDGQFINIISRKDLYASAPICTLAMYSQIDPNGDPPIYPISSVDADIKHVFSQGLVRGAQGIEVNMADKSSAIKSTDPSKRDNKVLGATTDVPSASVASPFKAQQQRVPSDKTQNPKTVQSIVATPEHPTDQSEDMQQYADDAAAKAFELTATGVAIPWIVPGRLVNVNIGGIKSLGGLYLLRSVSWVIDSNGAEATYQLNREIGANKVADVGLDQNTKTPIAGAGRNSASSSIGSLVKGLIS